MENDSTPIKYKINEIFYSLQGEGYRAGTANIFIRFAGCDLRCNFCDTDFDNFELFDLTQLYKVVSTFPCQSIIFTGGEPSLQLDAELVNYFKNKDYYLAIETNGLHSIPKNIDWICISPKTLESKLKLKSANEIKYVLKRGDPLPETTIITNNFLISPMFDGNHLARENLDYCVELVKTHPRWKLSVQQHKYWNIP